MKLNIFCGKYFLLLFVFFLFFLFFFINFLDVKEKSKDLDKTHTSLIEKINGEKIKFYISDNEKKRSSGLSNTKSLCKNCAMFFIFEEEKILSFWMKDMNYPIDIVFLDKDFFVLNVYENVSQETYPKSFYSSQKAKYAIEFNAFNSKKLNIKLKQKIKSLANLENKLKTEKD